MSKTSKLPANRSSIRPTIVLPTRKQEAAILAAAKSDPNAQPLTAAQLAAMTPLKSLRGRPKSPTTKTLLSVRYSPEVVAYFKSTGAGWQARMDGVLRNYVTKNSRAASTERKIVPRKKTAVRLSGTTA